jgi:hypothetical protein
MAPVATHPPSDDISKSTVSEKGPALVIGSLSTAQDGKYQRIVSELEATRQVERQMLDRLLDRGDAFIFIEEPHSHLQKLLFSRRNFTRRFISPFPLMIIKFCNPVYQSCFPNSTKDFHPWGHCTYFT